MDDQRPAPTDAGESTPTAQRLGPVPLGILIILLTVLPAFSMDMYLPALPSMTVYFDTTSAFVNYTIITYNITFALCIVVSGTLSDTYGRRPIVLIGLLCYVAGCLSSAFAGNVYILMATRALMGVGAGACSTISTALIKDCFPARKREGLLMVVQLGFVFAPIIAPVIGARILIVASWRMTFLVLSVVGVLLLLFCLPLRESLPADQRYTGTLAGSVTKLAGILSNRGFTLFLIVTSVFALPFMGYISCSSYIYIDGFGLSAQVYSYYFASAAACTILAPPIYLFLKRFMNLRQITFLLIGVIALSGLGVLLIGHKGPLVFFACLAPFYIANAAIRPYSTNILLSQFKGDTGSVSALINFLFTGIGVIGMVFVSLPWSDYILAFGTSILLAVVISLSVWIYILRRPVDVKGLWDPRK